MTHSTIPAVFHSTLSQAARARFLVSEGRPLFQCEWPRVVFAHYQVEPAILQPKVPFELELFEGRAIVSLVAFTMRRFRPYRGGRFAEWLFLPVATNSFFNVRTYVRHGGEAGAYFMTQWLSHPFCLVGRLPGLRLPWHLGRIHCHHGDEPGRLTGRVCDGRGSGLAYSATLPRDVRFSTAEPGSLAEFAMERYTAFALLDGTEVAFRIWHEAWPQCRAELEIEDRGLLAQTGGWHRGARLAAGNYSVGCGQVWLGRVRRTGSDRGKRRRLGARVSSAFYEMP